MADVSKIDQALAAAKARREQHSEDATTEPTEKKSSKRLTDEERTARDAKREQEKVERKSQRDVTRAAKKLERDSSKVPAHLSKVKKAFERLPSLTDASLTVFNDVTSNMPREQVNALAQHLLHHNRVASTTRALEQTLEAGDKVRIVSGDQRYVGQVGTVEKAQRIRCYVTLAEGKRAYMFTSDVEKVDAGEQKKSA